MFIIAFAIFILILCFALPTFAIYILPIDRFLGYFANIVSYFGLVFSAVALLIAALAFRVGVLRPKLRLEIHPWQGEVNKLCLQVNKKTGAIEGSRPNHEWYIYLINDGNATARYPVVEIIFNGFFFGGDSLESWEPTHHANAFGWYGFRWPPGHKEVVHPGLPIKLPTMSLHSAHFEDNDNPSIQVSIVSDGFDKITYGVPIELY
jgi:hypothetical protein